MPLVPPPLPSPPPSTTNMSKPALPDNFIAWGKAEVMRFFEGYDELDEDDIHKIETLSLRGSTLPILNEEKLMKYGISLGLTHTIIQILQEAKILGKSQIIPF